MKIYERLDMHDRVAFQRLIKNKVEFPEVIKKYHLEFTRGVQHNFVGIYRGKARNLEITGVFSKKHASPSSNQPVCFWNILASSL